MKKIILAFGLAILTFGLAFGNETSEFEPTYDTDTKALNNFATWGEYESWCWRNGIEPTFSEDDEVDESLGHCDFDAMDRDGIDEEVELEKLMSNID